MIQLLGCFVRQKSVGTKRLNEKEGEKNENYIHKNRDGGNY